MIELSEDMRLRLSTALTDGYPVVAASVDDDGQPHLSFFGTTQVLTTDQLALWARNPGTSFLQRIAANPKVALLYRNSAERVTFQFHGRARVESDEDIRRRVYDASPEIERSMDADRAGVAVVIDVDTVRGRSQGQPLEMDR